MRFLLLYFYPVPTTIKTVVFSLGLFIGCCAFAQLVDSDQQQLTLAREAAAKQDWRTAEALLVPLSQKPSQTLNPFVLYELALIYENTRRVDAAKKIYQELTTSPDVARRQPTIVIRASSASRLLSLVSLAQTKLNAIEAKQAAALPLPPQLPEPVQTKSVVVAPASVPIAAATVPATHSQEVMTIAISAALKNWADAWSRKDLPRYYASYIDNFRAHFSTPQAWREQRQHEITKNKFIRIDMQNVSMLAISPTNVQVQYQQVYTTDTAKTISNHILAFVSKNGQWLIEWEASK